MLVLINEKLRQHSLWDKPLGAYLSVRKLSTLVIICLAAFTARVSYGLGLGDIEVYSALNQTLDAEIALTSVRPGETDGMIIKLASEEAFLQAGVERPFYLTKIKFELASKADGTPYIKLSTQNPLKEPFVNFLVDIDWPRGRLVREYTILLDPPVFNTTSPAQPASTPAQTPSGDFDADTSVAGQPALIERDTDTAAEDFGFEDDFEAVEEDPFEGEFDEDLSFDDESSSGLTPIPDIEIDTADDAAAGDLESELDETFTDAGLATEEDAGLTESELAAEESDLGFEDDFAEDEFIEDDFAADDFAADDFGNEDDFIADESLDDGSLSLEDELLQDEFLEDELAAEEALLAEEDELASFEDELAAEEFDEGAFDEGADFDVAADSAAPSDIPDIDISLDDSIPYDEETTQALLAQFAAEDAVGGSSSTLSGDEYEVESGDTLWEIAENYKPADVSVHQAMLAILRQNPDAFIENNINNVRKGFVLRMPDRNSLTALDNAQAVAEVQQQNALWREYRERFAGAASTEYDAADSYSDSDYSDYEQEQSGSLSILSPGRDADATARAAGEQEGLDSGSSLAVDLQLAREQLAALRLEKNELESRLTDVSDQLETAERMLTIKDEQLAQLQSRLANLEATVQEAADQTAAVDEFAQDEFSDDGFAADDEFATDEFSEDSSSDDSLGLDNEFGAEDEFTADDEFSADTDSFAGDTDFGAEDEFASDEFADDEFAQDEFSDDEFAADAGEDSFAGDEFAADAGEDSFAGDEFADDEFAGDEFAGDEFAGDEFADDEFAEDALATDDSELSLDNTADTAAPPPTVVAAPSPSRPSGFIAGMAYDLLPSPYNSMAADILSSTAGLAVVLIVPLLLIFLLFRLFKKGGDDKVVESETSEPASLGERLSAMFAPITNLFGKKKQDETNFEQTADVSAAVAEAADDVPPIEESEVVEEAVEAPVEEEEPAGDFDSDSTMIMGKPPQYTETERLAPGAAAPAEAEEEVADDTTAEADVYLAYGLFDQAEELLATAIGANPDRIEYKGKLLETFFAAGKKDEFNKLAAEMHASLNGKPSRTWDKAVAMGKEIAPDNSLFVGAADSGLKASDFAPAKPETADFDIGDAGDSATADFDLDFGGDEPAEASTSTDFDLDLGDEDSAASSSASSDEYDETVISPANGELDEADETQILDASGDLEPASTDTELDDELEFDLADSIDEASESVADLDIDFNADELGLGDEEPPASAEAVSDAAEIDLDIAGDLDAAEDVVDLDADLGLDDSADDVFDDLDSEATVVESAPEATVAFAGFNLDDENDAGTEGAEAAADDVSADLLDAEDVNGIEDVDDDFDLDLGDIGEQAGDDLIAELDDSNDDIELDLSEDSSETEFDLTDDDTIIDAEMDDADDTISGDNSEGLDEVSTKLDLAKAYMDMGDNDGASSTLEEVLAEGNAEQKREAEALLQQIA